VTRKTQYGWMVVGGILCLCGGVVVLKVREGNLAVAQSETPPKPPVATAEGPPPPAIPIIQDLPKAPLQDPAPPLSDAKLPPPGPLPEPPPPPPIGPISPPAFDPPPAPLPSPLVQIPAPPPPPAAAEPEPAPGPTFISGLKGAQIPDPLPPAPPGSIEPPPPAAPSLKNPAWNDPIAPPALKVAVQPAPVPIMPPAIVQVSQVGEPPLAGSGPMQTYQVRTNGETMRDIARRTLGNGERVVEVYKLNPSLHPDDGLNAGAVVHLPSDACLPVDEVEGLKPLPAMRPKTAPTKVRTVMALTGTYPCNIDDKRTISLPRAVREQFGEAELVLVSPGPDQCLWLTDAAHQERLADRLEHSPAREIDVRVFKRLYYAQTEKLMVGADGRVVISDRLTQFAGLSTEVVLVGIDDHFEIWDAARWKQYTQIKSATAPGSE
jgi:MraZ protein